MSAGRFVVHVGDRRAGVLVAEPTGRHVFAYDPDCPPDRFVALTMPVRVESYAWHELHPVFQVGLPDGAHLARLVARPGRHGPLRPVDLAAGLGESAPGRVRILADGAGDGATAADSAPRSSAALVRRDEPDLPHRAFNGWCCLRIARRAGIEVPAFELADDGRELRVERFDGAADARLGYEDFCALTGLGAAQKYEGTAERLVSAASGFVPAVSRTGVRRELFRRLALATLLHWGEACLRSFGLVYAGAGDVRLAPLLDPYTTSVYPELREDAPALSIGGRRTWQPKKGTWRRFGAHCSLSDREVQSIVGWLGQALEAEIPALEREPAAAARAGFLAELVRTWRTGASELAAGY